MLEAVLALARLAHYLAATGLFGLGLFAVWAWPVRKGLLIGAAVAALLTTSIWLVANGAAMVGGFEGLADPVTRSAVAGTSFGRIGMGRLLVAIVICYLAARRDGKVRAQVLAILSGALLASLALNGHTQIHEGGLLTVQETLDALHLLGAGAWLGGLVALAILLGTDRPDIAQKVTAFSMVGYVAVGVLVITGLVNAALILPVPSALLTTLYGKLLLAKIALFAAMLGLAMYNRLRISPAIARSETFVAGVRRLRINVFCEQTLGALVLMLVAVLGTLDPTA